MHILTDDRFTTRRRLVVALTTFLLVSTFVIRASDAAFEASYTNEASAFSTGTLTLDSDVDVALFGDTVTGALFRGVDLNRGETASGCIDIELDTSLDAGVLDDVTFAVSYPPEEDLGLAGDLTLNVDLLDGSCTDTPRDVDDNVLPGVVLADATSEVDTGWEPTATETRGFAISVTVGADADQGASVTGVDLTWAITTSNN